MTGQQASRQLRISEPVERAIRLGVGAFFGLAALSDLRGSELLLPGISPPEFSRGLQLSIGGAVMLCAVLVLRRRLAKVGAVLLTVAWVLRSVWDMTGPSQYPGFVWPLLLGALSIIFWWRPDTTVEPRDA